METTPLVEIVTGTVTASNSLTTLIEKLSGGKHRECSLLVESPAGSAALADVQAHWQARVGGPWRTLLSGADWSATDIAALKQGDSSLITLAAGCAGAGAGSNNASPRAEAAQTIDQRAASQPAGAQAPVGAGVSKNDVKAIGDQSGGGGWTVNVGTLEVGGSTLAVLAVVALLWVRGSRFKGIVDLLVAHNEKHGLTAEGKKRIALKAASAGVGRVLDSRVKKVRRNLLMSKQSPV
jgi:hypothetical protein